MYCTSNAFNDRKLAMGLSSFRIYAHMWNFCRADDNSEHQSKEKRWHAIGKNKFSHSLSHMLDVDKWRSLLLPGKIRRMLMSFHMDDVSTYTCIYSKEWERSFEVILTFVSIHIR